MAQFNADNYLSRTNPFDNLVDFTAEAFINTQANRTVTQYVMGQYAFQNGNRSWALGKATSTGTHPAGANELFLILSDDGDTNTIVPLGLTPELHKDYYVAVSFNGTSSTDDITFYYQNLSDGGALMSSIISSGIEKVHNVIGTASGQDFRIGDGGGNRPWNGLIDEVRISSAVLEESELLIIPEPGTLILLGLSGLALWLTQRGSRSRLCHTPPTPQA